MAGYREGGPACEVGPGCAVGGSAAEPDGRGIGCLLHVRRIGPMGTRMSVDTLLQRVGSRGNSLFASPKQAKTNPAAVSFPTDCASDCPKQLSPI